MQGIQLVLPMHPFPYVLIHVRFELVKCVNLLTLFQALMSRVTSAHSLARTEGA